ncbi:hypothetical protein DPMN_068638 [Dreissena polymorpha]|uniref:Uncharacterized protein n=1 Tax=Dreissena polymorpha TaxID=45954 RepID=A0A9D3Z1Z5_DREPO|nr:hypothetical protein DPMN_068638 [Dreissena polymorpha]
MNALILAFTAASHEKHFWALGSELQASQETRWPHGRNAIHTSFLRQRRRFDINVAF